MAAIYLNYATQLKRLWNEFEKPTNIGECGWDHTYYEPGMPGYLAMYHNALWVSLVNGACTTPFWWAHSDRINDSMVTHQLLYFSRFVSDIPFADGQWKPLEIDAGECDAWALAGETLVFGWVVNPKTSLADETFTVTGLPDGEYEVRIYRTWRGSYLEPQTVAAENGRLSVTIPELRTTRGRASHIGNDIAFKIRPAGE